jgi:diguanylate cyclase (GGDEF)-like protein
MARRVLAPAEQLDWAASHLSDLYDRARLDSLHDALTGLGNHRAFQDELKRELGLAERHGTPLALLLADVDDLKKVNDEAGHAAGDELLQAMGRLATAAIRGSDRAFRIGGDEFAVLLPRADADQAFAVGRRMLATALEGGGGQTVRPFSFSAGISAIELVGPGGDLYEQADAALLWCKRHGRTGVQVYDADRHGQPRDRSTPARTAAVAKVAEGRLLDPVYQPIFSLDTGAPLGFEGLVRPRKGSGFRDADALFAAAEAAGRTIELDRACLDVVARSAAKRAGECYLALNISPRTLEAEEFSARELAGILDGHGIDPEEVVLELTEREAVEDLDRLRQGLAACRALGMRLAADDVGAGNSGLRLLSQIHFDIVKIDLSLVQGGVMRESSLAVLRALLDLAERWQATVVAEGIETPHQLEVVRGLGIRAGQGYLLGRPGPALETEAVDIEELLARDDWLRPRSKPAKSAVASTPVA